MDDIKMTGLDSETLDRIKKNIMHLFPSPPKGDASEKGPTNLEIYNQIYGDTGISEGAKKNKISDLRSGKGISLNDIIKIAAWKGLSLDWLILGKEPTTETPPVSQEEKAATEKSETEIDTSLPPNDDTLINSLLNNFKMPVLQTCATLLNLFKYANISIIGDYDINNFDNPQTLTVKISPKCFSSAGKYFEVEGNFCRFSPDNFTDPAIVYWDVRTTLIQRLLAIACHEKYQTPFPRSRFSILFSKK